MDCSPPGSSVHGISQARILEWVAISFSRGSFPPRDRTCIPCISRWILHHWATKRGLEGGDRSKNTANLRAMPGSIPNYGNKVSHTNFSGFPVYGKDTFRTSLVLQDFPGVLQWLRNEFDCWFRKIPYAKGQRSLCTTNAEPSLWSPRSVTRGHSSDKPWHHKQRVALTCRN